MKTIINARIYDYKNYIENGYVRFDKEIVEVGPMEAFVNNGYEEIENANRDLVLPSFVCAHSHIYSIFARGLSIPFNPKSFQDILKQMWWKLDSKITNDISYYSGIAAASEFLLNGVTTVIDHHASGQIRGSLHALQSAVTGVAGMRGIYCFETSDRYNSFDCIYENSEFSSLHKSPKCAGIIGMHASMTLEDNTLEKTKSIIEDQPIHIHVAESYADEEDCIGKYKCRIIERFDKFNLLNDDSLIVHGVYLNNKELEILSKKKVSIVVNTTSNMNNAVGLPLVKQYLKYGIPVMVGNDGLSSNMASEYMNVYYTSHLENLSPKEITIGDVKQMILNAYDYVSRILGIKIGEIKEGHVADLMRVKYSPFTEIDATNVFGHIFFGLFPAFKPSDVYVDGEHVVKDYVLTNSQLLAELVDAKRHADELWTKVKEEK